MYQNKNWQLIVSWYSVKHLTKILLIDRLYMLGIFLSPPKNSSSQLRALVSIASSIIPCHSTMLDSETPAERDSVVCPISWDMGNKLGHGDFISSEGMLCHCRYTVLVFTSMNTSEGICYSVKLQNWTLQTRQASLTLFSDGLCIRSFLVFAGRNPERNQWAWWSRASVTRSFETILCFPMAHEGRRRTTNAIPNVVLCVVPVEVMGIYTKQ